jgi:hypothetical protein
LITCVCVNLVATAMYFSLSGPYLDLGSDSSDLVLAITAAASKT